MDAESRVDGEDGNQGASEESPAAAQGEGAPSEQQPGAAEAVSQPAGEASEQAAEQPAGQGSDEPAAEATAEAAGEATAETAAEATGEAAEAGDAPDESQREGSSEDEDEDGDEVTYELRPPAQGMVTSLSVEQVDEDATFRIRPEGEITQLATDLARLGQLFPVDVRPLGADRYQIICGFRRVAALRFLKRDQVQARVHEGLSDDDALMMALASAIHASPVDREELETKRDQLEEQGRLSAAARDMLEKALATEDGLAPETMEEEVDADELAGAVSQRLGEINQDLSLLADVFKSLDESRRAELLMQLRYSAELVAYLEGL
ncbi:MAG TPA: ParB/RepB/Spo0J family partition protein [Myxococcaceae bacterium]|nr:ParB/RepB/Spo0J family partition protein [Myxococcaceae bacterium]